VRQAIENPLEDILAVTFDAGGTLIEPFPSVGHVYAGVAAQHGLEIDPAALNRQFAVAWRSRNNFGYSLAEWAGLVDSTFAGLTEVIPSRTFFQKLYERFAEPDVWRIYDDVRPTLEFLGERGIRLGVISNWDERLRPLLRALGLSDYFETMTVSIEVGFRKPAPEIFQRAASELGLPASKILHIGDSASEDVEGASQSGMKSLLLSRHGSSSALAWLIGVAG
jgi:putative hydrolase of the HAD superfamily